MKISIFLMSLILTLIPWHSSNKSQVDEYIKNNANIIFKNVISYIIRLSNTDQVKYLKRKIICRGTPIITLFNNVKESFDHQSYVIVNHNNNVEVFNSFLTVIDIQETSFFVFTGGSSMELPKLTYNVRAISDDHKIPSVVTGPATKQLKDFINDYELP